MTKDELLEKLFDIGARQKAGRKDEESDHAALVICQARVNGGMCGKPATAKVEGWPVCDRHALMAIEGVWFAICPEAQADDPELIELVGDPK